MSRPRMRICVEAWPDCAEGEYDPRCCRFPKSCSCTVYDPEHVPPDALKDVESDECRPVDITAGHEPQFNIGWTYETDDGEVRVLDRRELASNLLRAVSTFAYLVSVRYTREPGTVRSMWWLEHELEAAGALTLPLDQRMADQP